MAQTPQGARRAAATKLGMSLKGYEAEIAAGRKWCHRGKHWVSRGDFVVDRARRDGLYAVCTPCRRG
jgi:hypothetical protein